MASEKKSLIGRRVKEGSVHIYEVRPRKDKRGVALISDVLRYGAVWYTGPNAVVNAISGAKFQSQSQPAVIRVYDEAGNVIETFEYKDEFKEWWGSRPLAPAGAVADLDDLLLRE